MKTRKLLNVKSEKRIPQYVRSPSDLLHRLLAVNSDKEVYYLVVISDPKRPVFTEQAFLGSPCYLNLYNNGVLIAPFRLHSRFFFPNSTVFFFVYN